MERQERARLGRVLNSRSERILYLILEAIESHRFIEELSGIDLHLRKISLTTGRRRERLEGGTSTRKYCSSAGMTFPVSSFDFF